MKVIFLDIDGVLNAVDYMVSLHHNFRSKVDKGLTSYPIPNDVVRDEYGQYFDPRCVNYLESIVNFTGAKIVVSSTWRKDGLQRMKNLWQYRELPGEIIDITPILYRPRGEEIAAWLEENDHVTNYCIIDDDSDMLISQHLNFVQTNGEFGLTFKDTERIVEILNNEKDSS